MQPNSLPILEVRNLVKHYPVRGRQRSQSPDGSLSPWVKAVNGVSFTIRPGSCFGLLGPNGAGKTTILEVIEGIAEPTSGEIYFQGQPIFREGARTSFNERFRQKTGIQFQSTALQDYLSVQEALTLFQSFYADHAKIEELIELCSLKEFLNRDTDQLSGGQRQRVLLAIALVNNPDLIFLDEPTTGLDPQARRNFWDLVRTIKAQGKTIILTTHYMDEAYELCDEIAIMDRGKILAQDAPDALLKKHFNQVFVELPKEDFTLDLKFNGWNAVDRNGTIEIKTQDVNATLRTLIDSGVSLARMKVRPHTLEDLFIELTGKDLRG
jgi:ABC-2 type transport system ATP-binding protein